jgi:hypothetical protein
MYILPESDSEKGDHKSDEDDDTDDLALRQNRNKKRSLVPESGFADLNE